MTVQKPRIEIKNLTVQKTPLPKYHTKGSAGLDLIAETYHRVEIPPKESRVFKTGIAVSIQDPSIVGLVVSRSGLVRNWGIRVQNAPGIIDSDYTGEIQVVLYNDNTFPYTVCGGDRIAQLVFIPVIQAQLVEVTEFSIETERGANGFGSTGLR